MFVRKLLQIVIISQQHRRHLFGLKCNFLHHLMKYLHTLAKCRLGVTAINSCYVQKTAKVSC